MCEMQCRIRDDTRDSKSKDASPVMVSSEFSVELNCIVQHGGRNCGLSLFIYQWCRQEEVLSYAVSGRLFDLPLESRKVMSPSGFGVSKFQASTAPKNKLGLVSGGLCSLYLPCPSLPFSAW